MKTTLLIFLTLISFFTKGLCNNSKGNEGIKDGSYKATVQYSNYSTGTNSNYTLIVDVQDDKVISIDFGNDGSVHAGYNNEGYIYSGGYLSFETDYDGNITTASTTVTISDSNGMRYYKIKIE